jgi:hypothetical protein
VKRSRGGGGVNNAVLLRGESKIIDSKVIVIV